jgi:hypothetical protein
MRRRLLALPAATLVSGTVAGTVASAKGSDTSTARIPAVPLSREVANLTELWRELRGCR